LLQILYKSLPVFGYIFVCHELPPSQILLIDIEAANLRNGTIDLITQQLHYLVANGVILDQKATEIS
jgi:hypothetical protein